jgi:hypothetical protein
MNNKLSLQNMKTKSKFKKKWLFHFPFTHSCREIKVISTLKYTVSLDCFSGDLLPKIQKQNTTVKVIHFDTPISKGGVFRVKENSRNSCITRDP